MPSSFTLGTHFEGFIKQQVTSGRYASASEVIRDSLRLLEEQEAMRQARLEALRNDITQGTASGPGIAAEQVFAKARQHVADIAAGNADS